MRSIVMSHRGRFQNGHSAETLAAALHDPHNVIWLDIQDATDEDVALLREQFGFHPLAIEDATRAHERPKVDAYGVPGDIDGDGVADIVPPVETGPVESGSAVPDAVQDTLDAAASNPEFEGWADEEPEESVLIPLDTSPAIIPDEDEGLIERGYYFVVFYAAIFDPQEDHIRGNPISLFIGANYLVTVHAGPIPHIGETIARWRAPEKPHGASRRHPRVLPARRDGGRLLPAHGSGGRPGGGAGGCDFHPFRREVNRNHLSIEEGSARHAPDRRAGARCAQRVAAPPTARLLTGGCGLPAGCL